MLVFKHYLITRFNLRVPNWEIDKNKQLVQTKEWLLQRIFLFEKYCLPSIISQTNRNFQWLVFFDENSPEILSEKIVEWSNQCENFIPLYSKDYNSFMRQDLPNYIRSHIPNDCDYLVTTRIDNDDAFHRSAIEVIQKSFIPQHNTIIDCINGYCYNIQTKICTEYTMRSNPFISYIESVHSSLKTVFGEEHPNWKDKAMFITITSPRLWFQLIHGTNVINEQHGIVCFLPQMSNFGIEKLPSISLLYITKHRYKSLYLLQKHKVKVFLYKIVGKQI